MPNDRVPLTKEVNVQPNVVESTGTTTQSNQESQTYTESPNPVSFLDFADYHRLADFFNINELDRKDTHIADELAYLYDWGKEETKSEDRLQVSLCLKELAKRIGVPETGKSLIKKLYQWVRLDYDRKRIEQKMDTLSIYQHAEKAPVTNPS